MDEWWKSSPTVDDDSWYKSSPVIEAAPSKKLAPADTRSGGQIFGEGISKASPYQPTPKQFNPVQNGRQFSLGGGRGSETQEPPPDIMRVGPLKHVMDRTGTSTSIPGKLRPSSEPLETTVAQMKGAKGVAARAGLGFVKGVGFGSQPTPEDIAMKLSMPLLGGIGPVASTALGETFQAPETINAIKNRDWEALAASLGIGAIPGIVHGTAKGLSYLKRPAPTEPAKTEAQVPTLTRDEYDKQRAAELGVNWRTASPQEVGVPSGGQGARTTTNTKTGQTEIVVTPDRPYGTTTHELQHLVEDKMGIGQGPEGVKGRLDFTPEDEKLIDKLIVENSATEQEAIKQGYKPYQDPKTVDPRQLPRKAGEYYRTEEERIRWIISQYFKRGPEWVKANAPHIYEVLKKRGIDNYSHLMTPYDIATGKRPGRSTISDGKVEDMSMRPSGKDLQPFQRLKKPSAPSEMLNKPSLEARDLADAMPDTKPPARLYSGQSADAVIDFGANNPNRTARTGLHAQGLWLASDAEGAGEYGHSPSGRTTIEVIPKFKKTAYVFDTDVAKHPDAIEQLRKQGYDSAFMAQSGYWVALDKNAVEIVKKPSPTPAPEAPVSTGEGQAPPNPSNKYVSTDMQRVASDISARKADMIAIQEDPSYWAKRGNEIDAQLTEAIVKGHNRKAETLKAELARADSEFQRTSKASPVSPGEGQAPLLKGKQSASKIQSPTTVGEQSIGQEGSRLQRGSGVGPSLQGPEVAGEGQAQKEVTPKTLEQIVDEHDWVTSAPRAKQMLTAAQDISDRLDAGEKLSTKAAGGLGVKHGIPAPDMASLYKDIKASRVEPTSPLPEAPIKPLGTLQSSIVPGAEEFIKQDVGPAFEATKAAPGRIRQALGAIFNPPGIDEAAGQTARIIRGHGGEMARQTELAHSVLNDAKNYFRKALIARPPETAKGVAYSHPAIQFMDAVENGRPTGNAGLDATAQAIREGFDKRAAEAQKLGILNETIDDYFPHIWKKPGLTENIKAWIGGRRPFAGPESFRKQRSIPTISEGLQQGLKPVSWNPIELSLLKMREMDRSIMAHKAFNEMKDQGLAKFVRFGQDVPEGYRKLDDKIARVLERQETTKVSGDPGAPQFVMRGNYYAPEAAARVFNNYLSPGLRGNPLFDIAHGTSNVLNQAQLGLSAFHLMFTSIDAATSKLALGLQKVSEGKIASGGLDIGKAAIPFYSPLETYFKGSKGVKAYFDPKLAEGNPLFKEIDALQKAGGRVKMDSFYHNSSVESFWNALESHNYPGAVLRAPFALLQQAAKPIMEHVVPRQKMGVFMDMAEHELSKLPKDATLDMQRKVLQDSWDSVDNRMGQLVYDNLFWNRALKDMGLAGVRSLGWNLGTIRELGGGVKDVLGTPSRMKEGEPLISRRMAYTMALPMQVALTGSIIYYIANGKPPPTLRDAFQPTINGERMQPASYMKDIVPLGVSYQQEGVQGLLNRGKKMAQSKVNPGLATVIEMMNNEDYFGNKIRNDDAPLVDRAMQEVNYAVKQFQPFSLRDNPYRPNAPGSERAMQFFGITRVPRDRTQAEEKHMNAIRELMQERSSSPFGKGLGGANMKSLLK